MAIPSTGPVSLLDIAGEYGGTVPHAIDEYYGVHPNVATSGQITLGEFRGTSNQTVATGGTINDTGGYRYHTFAGTSFGTTGVLNDTFTVTNPGSGVEYIIIGAGLSGGGGGGVRVGSETLANGNYSVTAGAYSFGGGTQTYQNSVFRGLTSGGGNGLTPSTSGSPQNTAQITAGDCTSCSFLTYAACASGGHGGAGGSGTAANCGSPSPYDATSGNGGPGYLWLNGQRYGAGGYGGGNDAQDFNQGVYVAGSNGAGSTNYGSGCSGVPATSLVGAVIIRYLYP